MSVEVVVRLKLKAVREQASSILSADIPFKNVQDALEAILEVLHSLEIKLDEAVPIR